MSLKDHYNFILKYKKTIIITALLFGLIGLLTYFVYPVKHIATGAIYVSRTIQEDSNEFTYEGYYSQQNAALYTSTIAGMLENEVLLRDVLVAGNIEVTPSSLRYLSRNITITLQSPQLIEVSVSSKDPVQAENIWRLLIAQVQKVSDEIKQDGDPKLVVTPISADPVMTAPFRNMFLNILVGFIVGASFSLSFLSLRDYLSSNKS